MITRITDNVAGAVNLAEKTRYEDIASLAQKAVFAIGNDTGPMHLIALCGTKTLSLFSGKTDPARSAPRTPFARHLRKNDIADITVDEAAQEIHDWITGTP